MNASTCFVGLDVHQASIAVALPPCQLLFRTTPAATVAGVIFLVDGRNLALNAGGSLPKT